MGRFDEGGSRSRRAERTSPPNPTSHMHMLSLQDPRPEQSFGHPLGAERPKKTVCLFLI